MSVLPHPALKTRSVPAKLLYENREQILEEWMKRVKAEVPLARSIDNPILVNTIPLFIAKLAETLCEDAGQESTVDTSNLAQEHGGERARITRYGPDQLIQEYIILREVIAGKLATLTTLKDRETRIIQTAIDLAIQEAMNVFFMVHGRIREQFVATLTHDLRNPIGAVKGAAEEIHEVLKEKLSDASVADATDLCDRILRSAKRADRMIQDMLDASVVQTGERLNLQLTSCNVADIVAKAVAELPAKMKSRLKVESQPVDGWWDAEAMQRSVENLVSNAFKYGDASRPVTVTVGHAHERVMISVHNFGNPIPSESRENIFQVFRRTESAQKGAAKGWGIGLALARTTAERSGGSLGVESSLEKGTTFTIDVPQDSRPYQDMPDSSGR